MLIGYRFILFFNQKEDNCSLVSLALNATGGNNVIGHMNDLTASDRWPTHTRTEWSCFARSHASFGEIHSTSCKFKENYETETKDTFFCVLLLGGKPGLADLRIAPSYIISSNDLVRLRMYPFYIECC
jgi:hypothetical protein